MYERIKADRRGIRAISEKRYGNVEKQKGKRALELCAIQNACFCEGFKQGHEYASNRGGMQWVKVESVDSLPVKDGEWYEVSYGAKKPSREELSILQAKHYLSMGYNLRYLSESSPDTLREAVEDTAIKFAEYCGGVIPKDYKSVYEYFIKNVYQPIK